MLGMLLYLVLGLCVLVPLLWAVGAFNHVIRLRAQARRDFGNDTITSGERVHVVATTERRGDGLVLGRAPGARSLFDRLLGLLLRVVFGPGGSGAATRMLFQSSREFCFVWDDARAKPLQSQREAIALVGAFALGGAWILLCVTAFVGVLSG